jgi:hypothetical protein
MQVSEYVVMEFDETRFTRGLSGLLTGVDLA